MCEEIYIFSEKYYQKLGEVWDHETKDFKVLYKPLYACGSKEGSFEAHHLAVSTFERWERKFTKVQDPETLSEVQKHFLVSADNVRDLSAGNSALPLVTAPLPAVVSKSSAVVTVLVSDVVPLTTPLTLAASQATATAAAAVMRCRTQSGYGSRSLSPYYVLDFDPRWQHMIISGEKCATTRVLNAAIDGSEPHLQDLANAVLSQTLTASKHATSSSSSSSFSSSPSSWGPSSLDNDTGVDVYAVSGDTAFAQLKVTSVTTTFKFGTLTQDIAAMEQFETVRAFQDCLLRYYPTIQSEDAVYVFYFSVVTRVF